MIPPLAVLLVSALLGILAFRRPAPAQAQMAALPTSIPQQAAATPLPQMYDGSGMPIAAGAPGQPLAQVYDGSGQPIDPNAPQVSPQIYDGSGQIITPPAPIYDGAGQLVTETPVAQGVMQAEIVTQEAQAANAYAVEPTHTPIWNFFPNLQAAAQTALADHNDPIVLPAGASTSLASFFRPEVLHWGDSILGWAAQAGVDPNLAAVVMQIESCGDPTAVSSSGAIGLFQVMPYHFQANEDPFDPDTNARVGLSYLARSLQSGGGDARLALAGYNGGIGVIARGEWTWAAETARYVYFGWPIYEDARDGLVQSPALDDWYNRYGAGLCRQAGQHQ